MKLNQKAFTLIEIAITLSIVAILTVTAVGGYLKARDIALRNLCINNLKQIESAVEQWYINNRRTLPKLTTIERTEQWVISPEGSIIPNPIYDRHPYRVEWSELVPEYLTSIPECSGVQYQPPFLNQRPVCPNPELRKRGHHL